MKKDIFLLVIIVIIFIIGIWYIVKSNQKKVEIKDIESFHLSYSKGYAANSYVRYGLSYDKSKNCYIATIKPYGIDEDDYLEIEVDKKFRDNIKDVLVEYHVEKWNGFNKNNPNVLDGDSFSLNVKIDEDESISASGYMMWPENYRNVVSAIDNLFMTIYNNKKN